METWWRPVSKPLLRKMPPDDFVQQYGIHGFDHLIIQGRYDENSTSLARLTGWMVVDTRFHQGLDKWARWLVISFDTLAEVREWVRSGGPEIWNPEHRKTDRSWRPLPDGCSREETRSKVPRRSDPGVRDAVGMVGRSDRGREVRPGDGGPDFRGDHEDREPARVVGLKQKKYAVCPGWIRSVNDGQLHYINFGALTWLYGVRPDECIHVSAIQERGWNDEAFGHLVWLYPQDRHEDYESMKAELARGEDAFKLIEPQT